MTHAKLTIVVVLALAFGTAQCVASCTAVSCHEATVPPCHKHHQTVTHNTCGQDFLRPEAGASGFDMSALAAPSANIAMGIELESRDVAPALVLSPPGSSDSSLEVLRI
jgi:hypothetical protein